LPEAEQVCSCCGGALHEMSQEERIEIAYVPPKISGVKHIRYIYSCRNCERNEIKTPIKIAPAPKPVLPGSIVSPSMIACVMNQKFVMGLPLYRQEQDFARQGVKISRQTMANWMIQGSEKWLSSLYELLEIDNNRSDRSIKPFVIGRKNWLFANTSKGANASATIYSIVETVKENGLNPFEYLKFLFEKMPNMDLADRNAFDEILPWSKTLPDCCRV
jgi:transposase